MESVNVQLWNNTASVSSSSSGSSKSMYVCKAAPDLRAFTKAVLPRSDAPTAEGSKAFSHIVELGASHIRCIPTLSKYYKNTVLRSIDSDAKFVENQKKAFRNIESQCLDLSDQKNWQEVKESIQGGRVLVLVNLDAGDMDIVYLSRMLPFLLDVPPVGGPGVGAEESAADTESNPESKNEITFCIKSKRLYNALLSYESSDKSERAFWDRVVDAAESTEKRLRSNFRREVLVESEPTAATSSTNSPAKAAKTDGKTGEKSAENVGKQDAGKISTANINETGEPCLYVIGGRFRGKTLQTCERLRLNAVVKDDSENTEANASAGADAPGNAEAAWQLLPPLNFSRGSHASVALNTGKKVVYTFGGGGIDGNLDSIEMLKINAEAEEWGWDVCATCSDSTTDEKVSLINPLMRRKVSLVTARHALAAVASSGERSADGSHGDSIYVIGGWQYGTVFSDQVERFDTHTNGNLLPGKFCAPLEQPRRLHSAVTTDGSIFVFGGFKSEKEITATVERYDIAKNEWKFCKDLPYRDTCVQAVAMKKSIMVKGDNEATKAAVIEGENEVTTIYVFPFGEPAKSTRSRRPLGVSTYDPQEDSYKFVSVLMPLPDWSSFSAVGYGDQIYLCGGATQGQWTTACFRFDTRTNEFHKMPDMRQARRRGAVVVI